MVTTNVVLNGEKLKAFPLKSATRQGCPLPPLVFNTVMKAPVRAIRQVKDIKGVQIGNEEVQLSSSEDDINIIYRRP